MTNNDTMIPKMTDAPLMTKVLKNMVNRQGIVLRVFIEQTAVSKIG